MREISTTLPMVDPILLQELHSSMEVSVLEHWVPGAGAGAIFFYFFNSFVIQAKLGFS